MNSKLKTPSKYCRTYRACNIVTKEKKIQAIRKRMARKVRQTCYPYKLISRSQKQKYIGNEFENLNKLFYQISMFIKRIKR